MTEQRRHGVQSRRLEWVGVASFSQSLIGSLTNFILDNILTSFLLFLHNPNILLLVMFSGLMEEFQEDD